MFAAEVRHFCWQLFRGNVRALEVLSSPPDSIILSSPDWSKLLQILNDPSQMLTKSFLDRALGQAVGAIIKKKTVNGQLVLRDDISLTKFCDSFRYAISIGCDSLSVALFCARGPTLPQKAYEISKSLDFTEDFGISLKISRFHLRFPDFR